MSFVGSRTHSYGWSCRQRNTFAGGKGKREAGRGVMGGSVSNGIKGARGACARLFADVLACLVLAAFAWLSCVDETFGATGHGFVWSVSEASAGTGLATPRSVAVDGVSGRVFVGDSGSGYVDVFAGSGGFVTRFGGGMLGVAGVAVDEASGDVYVADAFAEGVDVYGPDGEGGYVLLGIWWGTAVPGKEFGEVAGVAVDNSAGPSSGDGYVVGARDRK